MHSESRTGTNGPQRSPLSSSSMDDSALGDNRKGFSASNVPIASPLAL